MAQQDVAVALGVVVVVASAVEGEVSRRGDGSQHCAKIFFRTNRTRTVQFIFCQEVCHGVGSSR